MKNNCLRHTSFRTMEIMRILLLADKPLSASEIASQLSAPIKKSKRTAAIDRVVDSMEVAGFITEVEKEKRQVRCRGGYAMRKVKVYSAKLEY